MRFVRPFGANSLVSDAAGAWSMRVRILLCYVDIWIWSRIPAWPCFQLRALQLVHFCSWLLFQVCSVVACAGHCISLVFCAPGTGH